MIYICIPSHNEEQTVGVVLWKIRQVMAELGRDYQLLVADDGSTDRTAEVLEPYTRVLPLTVLRAAERRGYAASLEMLLREAVERSKYPRRDSLIVLQADFTEDPDHIATLLKRLESGADIVASNATSETKRSPLLRRWSRALAGRIVRRMAWPDEVRDPLTGFCAYRVATVRQAMEDRDGRRLLTCEGVAANAELLRLASPHARRVDGVDFTPRRERLQRPTRFRPLLELRRVRALNGDGRTALDVAGLAPSAVVGGVSRQISTAGADERARGNGRSRQEAETPRRSRGGTRRSSGTRARPVGSGKSAAAEAAAKTDGAQPADGTAPAEGADQKRRRKPRKRPARSKTKAAPATDDARTAEPDSEPQAESASQPGEPAESGGEGAPKKRRRRGRRGGRGRRRKPTMEASGENGGDTADNGGEAALAPVPQEET